MNTQSSKCTCKRAVHLVYFISDFLQPWVMQNISDQELKEKLIRLLGSMKSAVYSSEGWH